MNQTFPGCDTTYTDFCLQTRVITACLLLQEIGAEDLADVLLANRAAMERLAHHSWDPIALSPHDMLRQHADASGVRIGATRADRARSLVADSTALLG